MVATISLGMIVKDEGRTLEACLKSVAPYVDEIVIGLAGESSDNTEEIARKFTDKILSIEWHDDFAEARNIVLDACSGDYYLWLDGDDILVGGDKLRAYIEQHPNIDVFHMGYDYGRDESGNNICYLIRERLVRRYRDLPVDYRWVGRVHEVLLTQYEGADLLKVDDIVVRHYKPADKHEPDRNKRILLQQLEEQEPNPDPRILVYLGQEAFVRGAVEEAIGYYTRFIRLSGWDEEKYQATCKIANLYLVNNQIEKSIKYAQEAIALLPEWPDAYYAMARAYVSQEKWRAALEYMKIGTSKPKPETPLILNPLEYNYEPSILLASIYVQLNDFEMALANYTNAFAVKKTDVVRDQIRLLHKEIQKQQAVSSFLALREFLGRHDEWLKVRKLYDCVPKLVELHPAIQDTWHRSMDQTAHILEPKIMEEFYTGNPHWAPMEDERILSSDWLKYPRLAYALEVAAKINAKSIVDWGCSDGFIALPLARETGAHVTGFDLDPRCVSLATLRAQKWGLDARFEVGNIDELRQENWEGPKADLAIFFEVIEHVLDPSVTLTRLEGSAKHIALTTPFLAWEHGNIAGWDRLEPKGHLRIFDTYDIERLLTGRGRIWNLYKQPWGDTGWIFADYEPGVETDKTIFIGAMGAIDQWGPNSLKGGGLGGSETAVIRLGEEFVQNGHRVFVYNDIDSPGYYNGVCYRPPEHFNPSIKSDVFIAWRWPEAADLGIRTDRLLLWMHDTDAGDRLTRERAERFDRIVVLTEWHKKFMMSRYPFLRDEQLIVIGNGVDLERFSEPVKKDPKKVVYSSSPDRGLDVILEGVWPRVLEEVPDAELHIYYGWNNFDKFAARFPQLVAVKQKIQELFLNSKNVVQHGRIPQDQLAREMQEATIWLYPTHFTETYCITAVEAQLAGALPVTNHLAGLAETVKSGIVLEGDVHDKNVQLKYAQMVIDLLKMPAEERDKLHKATRENAPAQSWSTVAGEWIRAFLEKEN